MRRKWRVILLCRRTRRPKLEPLDEDTLDPEVFMNGTLLKEMIWGAGAVHLGIIAANVPLPGRLRVRERLASVPRFIRQIFCVTGSTS
jgi:hypothetical protein